MKILNICMGAPFTEGYSYQDNLLSEYQQKHGHEVTIITTTRTRGNDGKIIQTPEGERILENGVKLIRINASNKLVQFLGYYPQLKKYISKCCPDMIFVHGLGTLVIKQAVDYKKKKKKIYIVADNHQDKINTNIKGISYRIHLTFFKLMWKYWIKYVEKVYGTTEWRKNFAKIFYGIPEEKLDVLMLGVDVDNFSLDRNKVRKDIRTKLDISENGFIYITGGKIDKKKCTLEVIKAFLKISKENAYFIIFGPVAEDIKKEFFELISMDSRIKYVGSIESKKIHQYFYAADFGVFPGYHSVLWEEAIGCSLPCLFRRYEENDHTNICGNCICMENPNVEKIYGHMKKAIDDKSWYADLKSRSKQAAEVFSYHEIAEKSVECCYKGDEVLYE